jgi:hypothetical protein
MSKAANAASVEGKEEHAHAEAHCGFAPVGLRLESSKLVVRIKERKRGNNSVRLGSLEDQNFVKVYFSIHTYHFVAPRRIVKSRTFFSTARSRRGPTEAGRQPNHHLVL